MAENDLKPMSDGDVTPPPATTDFEPAAPLKDAHVEFEAEATDNADAPADDASAAAQDRLGRYGEQVTEKVRGIADTGKARAGGALDQLATLLTDAAAQVDDRLGAQYGDYARSAAGQVRTLSDQVRDKNVDELLEDARALVRRSPTAAVGAAAALGFVVARLVQAGIDADRTAA